MAIKNETIQARVTRVLKNYTKNSAEMLAIIYEATAHFFEHNNKTPLLKIMDATHGTADYSIVSGILRQLTDGSVTTNTNKDKGLDIKVNNKTGKVWHDANVVTVKAAITKEVSFRNKEMLEKIGLSVGETKPFSLEGAATSFVKRALQNDVQLDLLVKAVREAYKAQVAEVAKADTKPQVDKNKEANKSEKTKAGAAALH